MPLIGSGWTGKVMFWCTPASFHHTREELGSADSHGCTPWIWRNVTVSPTSVMSTSAEDQRSIPFVSFSRQRPMWCDAATMPGRMPSVTKALMTKKPISVSTRARSPV